MTDEEERIKKDLEYLRGDHDKLEKYVFSLAKRNRSTEERLTKLETYQNAGAWIFGSIIAVLTVLFAGLAIFR